MSVVQSSNIYSINYYDGNLHVVFKSDLLKAYKYYGVKQEVYESILKSPSIGEAFDKLIIKSRPTYKFSKLPKVNADSGLPEQEENPSIQPFEDVISFLASKGLARRESDEEGNMRVVFLGNYVTEMAEYFKRNKL